MLNDNYSLSDNRVRRQLEAAAHVEYVLFKLFHNAKLMNNE